MTKIKQMTVKCKKCGFKSEQVAIFSVNYSLGNNKNNDELIEYKQKCPKCGYEAIDISQ